MYLLQKSKQLVIKKEEGNNAFKAGQYQQACELYTEGLSIDKYNKITNAKLHCNRALVESKVLTIPELKIMVSHSSFSNPLQHILGLSDSENNTITIVKQ